MSKTFPGTQYVLTRNSSQVNVSTKGTTKFLCQGQFLYTKIVKTTFDKVTTVSKPTVDSYTHPSS